MTDVDELEQSNSRLRAALEAMCAEFRAYDLPYGSKAYADAKAALTKEPT